MFRLSGKRRRSFPERLSGPLISLVNCRLSRPDRLSPPARRGPNLPLNFPPLSSAIRNSSSGASAIYTDISQIAFNVDPPIQHGTGCCLG